MSSPDIDSDTDSSVSKIDVTERLNELRDLVDEFVTNDPNDNGNDGNGDDRRAQFPEYYNVPGRIEALVRGIFTVTEYDERQEGQNYNILKEKYDDLSEVARAYASELQERVDMIPNLKRAHTRELNALNKKIQELKDRLNGVREPPIPWSHELRALLHQGKGSYYQIYRSSCRQENMSQKFTVLHPDLKLERGKISIEELLQRRQRELSKYVRKAQDGYVFNRRLMSMVLPEVFVAVQPIPTRLLGAPYFPFERLPAEIQIKIFARVFVKTGLVHCFSRLDPDNPPLAEDFPKEDEKGKSQLPTGFHYGSSPCRIALLRKPSSVLDPLLVCKRWYFVGVHVFYGANTFAFSSLGEWHRFCNGIGIRRVERLVNVEIMWHGSLMRRHPTRISRRTVGLAWFLMTRRLRTLVIHIQESAEDRVRRKYERPGKVTNRYAAEDRADNLFVHEDDFDIDSDDDSDDDHGHNDTCGPSDVPFNPVAELLKQTNRQPNKRRLRSMRTVQGIDYLYQLRGMNWIRFKEREKNPRRGPIADSSFLADLERVVTLPKRRSARLKTELQYLTPLTALREWIPSETDMQIIEAFYDESPDVEWNCGYGKSDDEDEYLGEIDSETEEDDEMDEDLDRGARRAAPRQQRAANPNCDTDQHARDAPMTPPNTPPGQANQKQQEHGNEAGKNARDDDDRSSGLFVSSRSNSNVPADRMDVDQEDSPGTAKVNTLGNRLWGKLRLFSNPRSKGSGSPDQNDPAGKSDHSGSLFVRTPTPTKVDPNDGSSREKAIDLTMLEEDNGDESDHAWDYDSDKDRFIKEETPPDDDGPPYEHLYAEVRKRRPRKRQNAGEHPDGSPGKKRKGSKTDKSKSELNKNKSKSDNIKSKADKSKSKSDKSKSKAKR